MYHEKTYRQQREHRRHRIAYAVLVLALTAAVVWLAALSHAVARGQATTAVRERIMGCAMQCCAVEGSYPSSLAHLESEYGLVVNARDYVVTYEWLGDNVPPSVVVRAR